MRYKAGARVLLSLCSLFSVVLLTLSACAASGTPTKSNSSTKPVHGGIWVDDLTNEPDSLIPNGGNQDFNTLVDQALYSPLFVGNAQGRITANLVTEVPDNKNGDISPDLKTWIFKLKPGLQWSDGAPLNADDIDYTWHLWTNPQFGAANTVGYNLISSADVSANKLTITFHLKQAYAPFLSVWTDGRTAPLPKHHFASMAAGAILKSPENLKPTVVSGPFTITESVPGDHYTLVRNPKYFRASEGLPYLDTLIFRPIASQETILNDFKAGKVTSSYFLDVSKTKTYKAIQGYTLVANPNASNYEFIAINFENPILGQHQEVRQAMALAIDHQALIQDARQGEAVPLCTDHGQSYNPGYQKDAPCPKYDPAAANKLLDDNGWIKGSDGIRTKGGQRLEFRYATTTGKPWRLADEDLIQANFLKIGIKINIDNQPSSTFFGPYMGGGHHDLAEYENSWTYDPDDAPLVSCSQIPSNNGGKGQNRSFHCDPVVQTLLKQEETSADPAVRQDAFDKMHQIYLTEFPFIILYSPIDISMARNTAHNYLPGPMGALETVNVWDWWCSSGHC